MENALLLHIKVDIFPNPYFYKKKKYSFWIIYCINYYIYVYSRNAALIKNGTFYCGGILISNNVILTSKIKLFYLLWKKQIPNRKCSF